jgi:rubrerythrin
MNINNIFNEIEKVDPEVYDKMDTRRNTMRQFANIGGKIALTAVPVLLGGMFKKAYAGDMAKPSILDVLNFALTLEYLEATFYMKALEAKNLIPSGMGDRWGIRIIAEDEKQHVEFLTSVIKSLGGTPVAKPEFDFTAGNGSGEGPFKGVFENYMIFLAVAQTFEDTGVRAYKGQAANLMSSDAILTAALQIHSVEARHAAHIRNVRSEMTNDRALKPWITLAKTGRIGAAVHPSYAGEQNTVQAGIQIVGINGQSIIDEEAASEAFDEPLTMKQVLAIVDGFIV